MNESFHNDTYTHVPLIPLISLFLICGDRRTIFDRITYSWSRGLAVLVVGVIAIITARFNVPDLSSINQLSIFVFGAILVFIGTFVSCFGSRSFKAASFSLLFLFFMVPIPEPLLSKIVLFLQEGSARATAVLFGIFGVPFLQNDLIFYLPGMAIRIAEECSGIRSTLALIIITVLASHFYLKATWKQLIVCLLVVPLSIIKNGLRISVLSALAVYVSPEFLTGPIHHRFGGMIFFAAAFIPLAVVFMLLKRTEDGVSERDVSLNARLSD